MQADIKRPLIGVAVVVIREGRILLGKRKNAHGAGTWQLPGGHLEFNESIEACARREVFEETGLHVDDLVRGPYTNDIFEDEGKHYVTLFVIARRCDGEPVLKEPQKCDRWDWFSWNDLPAPKFLPLSSLVALGFDPFNVSNRP